MVRRFNIACFTASVTLLIMHFSVAHLADPVGLDCPQLRLNLWMMMGSSLLLGIGTAVSIMIYTKRDIIRITQPQGLRGIRRFLSTTFAHSFDLLLSPGLIIVSFYDIAPHYGVNVDIALLGTMSFVIMTLVQTGPLKVRKDYFFNQAKAEIRESLNIITTSRCSRENLDRRKKEFKVLYQEQIAAETLIRSHLDFLTLGNGFTMFLSSAARFLLPIAGTVLNLLIP